MSSFDEYLKELVHAVEVGMAHYLPEPELFPETLHEAMRYSVFAGGKRIRPVLVMAVAEACGAKQDKVLPAACAMEFVHTYSLIHDDLPAMDNDDYRRGRLTNHKVFGEAAAVLAGDALLTLAFRTLLECPLDPGTLVRLQKELADASGAGGMVGGQMADMIYEGKSVDAAALHYIHSHKTGALLRAAVRMGAIGAHASADVVERLTEYAESIGLSFQIMDDVLDVVGDAAVIGKNTGVDSVVGKATYPSLYGVKESMRKVEALTEEALRALQLCGDAVNGEFLRELAILMSKRDR